MIPRCPREPEAPGRLLRLASEDFQWLVDTEPAVKARLAQIVVGRLQQR
jgi:hypothetical protein